MKIIIYLISQSDSIYNIGSYFDVRIRDIIYLYMEIDYTNANNNTNYSQLESQRKQEDNLAHLYDGLSGQARRAFIAKVYGILASINLIIVQYNFSSQQECV